MGEKNCKLGKKKKIVALCMFVFIGALTTGAVSTTNQTRVEEELIETNEELAKFEVEDDFTFITKPTANDKIVERRNKLREFNSRYQVSDSENDFENVPAFKRKNILLEGSNASEQTISNFLSEDNGRMQVRENRFLNKDVD